MLCTHLVEDMVAPLVVLLVGDAGLFEQVEVDEAAGQLAHVVEVDPDELALKGMIEKVYIINCQNYCPCLSGLPDHIVQSWTSGCLKDCVKYFLMCSPSLLGQHGSCSIALTAC